MAARSSIAASTLTLPWQNWDLVTSTLKTLFRSFAQDRLDSDLAFFELQRGYKKNLKRIEFSTPR